MDRKIKKIMSMLHSLDWVLYVLQVGSSLEKQNTKDTDFLVGTTHSEQENYLAKLKYILELNGIENIKISDDALRFRFEKSVFDIALYEHEQVYAIVTGVVTGTRLEGRLAPWATKAWLPEGFCADLRLGRILYDKSGTLKSLIKSLQIYPQAFKEKIKERCVLEIESRFTELHGVGSKSLDSLLIKSDIVAALVRYVFASDGIYLRSYKKLNKKARELSPAGRELLALAKQINIREISLIEQKIKTKIKNKKNETKKY